MAVAFLARFCALWVEDEERGEQGSCGERRVDVEMGW